MFKLRMSKIQYFAISTLNKINKANNTISKTISQHALSCLI